MKELKEEKTVVVKVEKVICDCCGAIDDHKNFQFADVCSFSQRFGFGTPRDGDIVEFDLCADCLMDILNKSNVKYRYLTCDFPMEDPELIVDAG